MMQKDERNGVTKLKALREKAGKTQLRVAVDVGVNPQAVINWEKGSLPHLDKAFLLAKCLGISMDELCEAFGLTETETP
jgi:DNA-binding XRE family transcriptional regulator